MRSGDAPPDGLIEELVALETKLLDPEVRRDAAAVAALLHPDFFEYGRSGAAWTRADVLHALSSEAPRPLEIVHPSAVQLGEDAVLLLYRSASSSGEMTLRSSVWVRRGNLWVMRFHQGTPIPR